MNLSSSEVELSIVLPAYKEADSLALLLPLLKREAANLTSSYEILVIDAEHPIDRTSEICQDNQVVHVHRRGGNAYGDAVRTGLATLRGRFVIFMDADGSHNPSFLASLWKERERFDVVIGSRYVHGGATQNPLILIFMSYMVNTVFRFVLGLDCRDVSNSLRLYRRQHLQTLTLRSSNFDIIEEIIIKLCCGPTHCTVTEVPVTFERRKAGTSKRNLLLFAIGYFATLVRLFRFKMAAKLGQK